ncbi:class II fructose-bisphosphate aldolase [Endozoicomonas atrinae]|uniref:class II fructose-bisphosphate aldolase n=1 Tax=Endozoicomonas atrinae TaxID=1333660 RepID=UPI000824963D|nr:class II fructose-bisphosphate aldolase [Endozoicomonas atrinae]
MPLVTLREVLSDAAEKGYAVGSFNAIDVNLLRGLIAAAEQESSPIIINLGQGQFRLTPPEIMAPIMVHMAKEASVPVVIHLDHGKDVETCVRALRLGFSSVMYDGSAHSFEENLQNTKEVIRIARHFGASVEAEIGKVGNVETGDEEETATAPAVCEEDQLTNPEQARMFAESADIDALAVAFGTAHGLYKGEPKLDFQRLQTIGQQVSVPLVMHGGSGLDDSVYGEAIACGVSKINYFTNMSHDVGIQCLNVLNRGSEAFYHDTVLTAVNATRNHAARIMQVFGSSGKA